MRNSQKRGSRKGLRASVSHSALVELCTYHLSSLLRDSLTFEHHIFQKLEGSLRLYDLLYM